MTRRLSDDDLRARVRAAIASSVPRTELGFRLTAEGLSCGRERLWRVWEEEGGTLRWYRGRY